MDHEHNNRHRRIHPRRVKRRRSCFDNDDVEAEHKHDRCDAYRSLFSFPRRKEGLKPLDSSIDLRSMDRRKIWEKRRKMEGLSD